MVIQKTISVGDAECVLDNLRAADWHELCCSQRVLTPDLSDILTQVALGGVQGLFNQGVPFFMFQATASGVVWALGTDKVSDFPLATTRFSRRYLTLEFPKWGVLQNFVWKGNFLHIRWLHTLGFEFFACDRPDFLLFKRSTPYV